uniref:Putative thap4 protein n=1 Tax=Pseudodiaptomus poplesia TaxID=213370 RepID=A0A1S6GL45_9MAXI|nr:putative thap4 protein [Pseudodiaptomus poplesia]
MHRESGFLRPGPQGSVVLVAAHNFGMTSVEEGTMPTDTSLTLETTGISRMVGAKKPWVTHLKRVFTLEANGNLKQVAYMATENTELTTHLVVEYCPAS